jgi:hypothetical protein
VIFSVREAGRQGGKFNLNVGVLVLVNTSVLILVMGILMLVVMIVLLTIAAYLRARSPRRTALAPASESRYKPGQVWSLRIPGSPQARLKILRVESIPGAATFVHVAVDNVPVTVGHMPFYEAAIDQSVIDLVGTDPVRPESLEGYDVWRKAFDNEGAGVFSVTVAEALKVL